MHYFVPPGVQNFAHLSAENLCILLLIVSPLVAIKKHYLKFALTIFGYCGFLNALFILFRFFQGVDPYWRVGFIVSNASMDATIVALTYPFFIKDNPLTDIRHKSSILFYAIPLIAIIVAQKWVGIGTAIVMLLTLILRKNFIRYKYVKPMLYAIAPASILSLMAVTLLKFIDSTGRADVWIQAFHFWKENANPWLGFGSNSSFQLLRLVQKLNDSDPNLGVFGWMHNEWLQFLFEQGILGLGSAIILYVALLIKSFKSPECFAAIVALGFAATANWPLHQPFTALFCATLSIYVLRETQWYRHN